MDTLHDVAAYFGLDLARRSPIEIPNTNRESLARLLGVLGFTRGVEVGVERGMYSEVLCRENPGVRLSCVDAWTAYRGYRDHVSQSKLDGFYVEAAARLKPYPGAELIRAFSLDAATQFADGSLDFVYIDAAHDLPSVINDLKAWTPKVRAGGIVSGHDYAKHRWPNQMHVVQAVGAWTDAYEIRPWFILGANAKVDGQLRDDARSWFWVQQPRPVIKGNRKPVRQ